MTIRNDIQVRKLSGHVGAEISGIRLGDIDDHDFARIHAAFLDHGLLVFRDQFLTPQQHADFGMRFGELMVYKGFEDKYRGDLPPAMFHFSNDGKDKVITENWHFDGTYYDAPPAIGILVPQRLPPCGGDTMWSNQYRAYEQLSDGMKAVLAGLRVRCESNRSSRKYGIGEILSATHPAVRKHPETGRLSLFIGSLDTCVSFVGMTPDESEPLIRFLYGRCCLPDNTYRHQWRLGDVVMWDNRCTMHYAIHDYGDAPRDMFRVTINGQPDQGANDG